MIEIRERYVLDAAGRSIAIQIPIDQFELLLGMLNDRNAVTLVAEDESQSVDALQAEVAMTSGRSWTIGLKALDEGRYTDYDAEGLQGFFDGIKQRGRSQRGIEA